MQNLSFRLVTVSDLSVDVTVLDQTGRWKEMEGIFIVQ